MEFPRTPKAVIFDMDGLLIDTIPIYAQAMVEAGVDVRHRVSKEYVLSLIGLLGNELQGRLSDDLGPAFPVAKYLDAMSVRLASLLSRGVPPKPGAKELVAGLHEAGVPLAIATSMKRLEAEHHLSTSGLRQFFRHIVGRDDVTQSKPHPDVYIKAAARLQMEPRQCLALEDSFSGIRSASSAGAMTIMVPDVLQPTKEIESLCISVAPDLGHVKRILDATIGLQEGPRAT